MCYIKVEVLDSHLTRPFVCVEAAQTSTFILQSGGRCEIKINNVLYYC